MHTAYNLKKHYTRFVAFAQQFTKSMNELFIFMYM